MKIATTLPMMFFFTLLAEIESGQVNWSNLSALGALIVVLIFIVTRLLPDMQKQQLEQAKTFATTSQAQTESSVQATADASAKATQAMAAMNKSFIETLNIMAERYHNDTTELAGAIADMSRNCVAHQSDTGATVHALRKQLHEAD